MADGFPKTSHFRWSTQARRAAVLIAEDDLTEEAIAAEVGVSRRTLYTWRQHPEFAAEVGDHVGRIQASMLRLAIAKKVKRLRTLDTLHSKALTVIDERAEAMADDAPGTGTGLLVHQIKQIGAGKSAFTVDEYTVDVALMREIRALEEQAAKELGQWVEKSEHDVKGLTFADLYQLAAADEGASPVGAGQGG